MTKKKSLEHLLEVWSVLFAGVWENEEGPKGWYAVCNDNGIIAYFADEKSAFRFRLSEINRVMNG